MLREQAAETMPCRRFHFGDHFIDLDQRLLYHGNLLLEPERKEYELIALLVEAYPRTLTRRALMDALWPSQEISDAALAQLIRRTRKLLEDDAHNPRYLKTIHGIGVRLLARPLDEKEYRETRQQSSSVTRILVIPIVSAEMQAPGNPFDAGRLKSEFAKALSRKIDSCRGLRVQFLLKTIPRPGQEDPLMEQYGCQALLQIGLLSNSLPRKGHVEFHWLRSRKVEIEEIEANSLTEMADQLQQLLPLLVDRNKHRTHEESENLSAETTDLQEMIRQGLHQLSRRSPREAESLFLKVLSIDENQLEARAGLASALEQMNRPEEAWSLVDELLATANLPPLLRLRTRRVCCNLLYTAGDIEASSTLARELIDEAEKLGNASEWVQVLIQYGSSERACGRDRVAIQTLEKAIRMARENKDGMSEAMALLNLGNTHLSYDQALALSCFEQSELIFDALQLDNHQAVANFQIGTLLRNRNELSRARNSFIKARACFHRTGDETNLARADIELIHIEMLKGDYEKSAEKFETLIGELERKKLEFPAWLARKFCARAWLNSHCPEKALPHIETERNFVPSDPAYRLLKAHYLYESGSPDAAVRYAEELKTDYQEMWQEDHEKLLQSYRRARDTGVWVPVTI